MVDDSIHYLQNRIDVKSVEARTSLDSIRQISKDVQNFTDKDIKLLYNEAAKHDRVAKNIVDMLVLLGITYSSTELVDPSKVRRNMVFYEKQKIRKNMVKTMVPLIKENRSDLSRRKSQFSDDKKAEHLWTVLNVTTNWCYKLCEYYNQYKSNVKKIDSMVEHINKLRIDLVTAEQQEYEEGKDVDDMMKRLMETNTSKDGNELDGGESSLLIDLNENILREETTFNDSQLSDQMKRSNIDGKNDDKLQ